MEEEGIDPFSVNRNPQIIKAAQEQIATMDVLVCGVCHSVFHFIEEFQDHKSKNECGTPAFKGNLTETKPQVWAFLLWKSSRAKSELGEGADQVSSWKLYQKWCKMPENIRDSWVCAGKAIQVSTTLATAKMQEVKAVGKVQMINKIKSNEKDSKDSVGTDIKKEGVVRKMTNIRGKPGRPPQGQDGKPCADDSGDKNKDGNVSVENGGADNALLSDTVEIKEEQVSEADVEDHALFEEEDEEEENRRTRLELGESIEDIDKGISRQTASKAGENKKSQGESDDSASVVRRKGKDGEKGNSDSEDEYVVERIVSRRYNIRKKAYEYLLKWEGYPDDQNTWEPEENLADCKHLLENFERNLAKQKAQQQQRSGSGYPGGPKMITATPDRRGSPKTVGRPVRSSKKKALDQVKAWCGSMYTKKPDEEGGQGSSEGSDDEDGIRKGRSLSESEDASQHADGNISSDDLSGRKRKKEDDDYKKGPGRPRKVIKVNGMPSASGKTIVASSNQELAKAIGEFITGFDGGATDKKTPIVLGKKETGGNITLTATQQPVLVANSKGVVKVDPRAMPNLASGVYIMSKSSPGAPSTGLIKVDSPVVVSSATPNVKVVSAGPGQKQGGILAMKDSKPGVANTSTTSPSVGSSPPKTVLGPKKPTVLGAAPSAVTPMKLLPKLVSPQIRGGGLVRMPQSPRPALAQSSPSPRPLVAPGAKLPLTPRPSLVSPQAPLSAGKGIRPIGMKPKQPLTVTGTKVSSSPLSTGVKSGMRPIEAMLGGTTPTAGSPPKTILGKKGTPGGSALAKDSTESAEASKTKVESIGLTPLRGTPANRGRAKGGRGGEGKSSENKTKLGADDSVAMELTEERNSDADSESDYGLSDDFPTGDLPPIEPDSPPRPLTLCPLTGKILARAEGEKTPPPSPPPAAPTTPLSEAILPDDGDGEGEETLIKVEMSPGGTTGTVVSEGGPLLRTEAGLTVKRLLAGGAQGNAANLLSTMTQLGGQVQGISLPARKLFTEDGTEIVESDTEMVTIQGEDGVVYQVQGELEDGTQTLLVQGEDGEQRCVYVTTNEGVEGEEGTVLTFGDPAYADAVAQLDPSQVEALSEGGSQILLQGEDGTTFSETQLMSVMEGDKEDGEAQIVAQVLEAGQPQPGGGPRKVVLLLPDGNMMMTEVDEEQYAALELDK